MSRKKSRRMSVSSEFADLVEGRRRAMIIKNGRPVSTAAVTREMAKRFRKNLGV